VSSGTKRKNEAGEEETMKWLLACLLVLSIVGPAVAGEDPYIAVVGNDIAATPFYFSPKYMQFLYDQTLFGVDVCSGTFPPVNQFTRVGLEGCEQFRSQGPTTLKERCEVGGPGDGDNVATLPNARVTAGNSGFFEWFVRLPKKPSGEINLVIQCGVLKPGGTDIELCAAETGERIGLGFCTRQEIDPGVSPVQNTALPKITAIAYPGPFNSFTPFNLTAFKNPSSYTLTIDVKTGGLLNNSNEQVLDGGVNTRILLKACMDKAVVAKLPVTGQLNALLQIENDLEAGDLIYVRLDIPRQNSVDIFCHAQSFRLQGVGESPF